MATVTRLADHRPDRAGTGIPEIRFERRELDQLLSVYSHRVKDGDWKDYAIRQDGDTAAFHAYRGASRQPCFTMVKHRLPAGRIEFVLYRGLERIRRAFSLSDALAASRRSLRPR